jgi:DNA-directed RNA polymerase specialized sigma24 family protein
MAGVIERKASRVRRAAASKPISNVGDVLALEGGFLARVVELLSPHEREALRMRHRDGMSDGAIAAQLKLPADAVGAMLVRAESTLRAAQRAFIDALVEARR